MANILITGAGGGIGLATTVELARRGERVFASMRDLSRSGTLEAAAKDAGVTVDIVQLDVTDPTSVKRAVEDAVAAGGSIDVVVNNAGTAAVGPLEFTTEEQVQMLFDTNVFGPLRVLRAVLPHMRSQRRGRIVSISSLAANPRLGIRLWGVYAATKAALATITLELAKEVAPLGIETVLMEAGVNARSSMQDSAGEVGARLGDPASDYIAAERVAQRQLSGMTNRTGPDPADSAGLIADACLLERVPLRYPPADNARIDRFKQLDDEQFLRLASLEMADELYDGAASPFWLLQRDIPNETSSVS